MFFLSLFVALMEVSLDLNDEWPTVVGEQTYNRQPPWPRCPHPLSATRIRSLIIASPNSSVPIQSKYSHSCTAHDWHGVVSSSLLWELPRQSPDTPLQSKSQSKLPACRLVEFAAGLVCKRGVLLESGANLWKICVSRLGAMMQCLSGSQLLSPVCTHVGAQRPSSSARSVPQLRRAAGLVARAESAPTSTSTVEPAVEPPSEVAVSPIPPAPKSIINEDTILSAITGDSKSRSCSLSPGTTLWIVKMWLVTWNPKPLRLFHVRVFLETSTEIWKNYVSLFLRVSQLGIEF